MFAGSIKHASFAETKFFAGFGVENHDVGAGWDTADRVWVIGGSTDGGGNKPQSFANAIAVADFNVFEVAGFEEV